MLDNLLALWETTGIYKMIYNIGEQVYKLSSEFKLEHPGIIWNIVSGLRHRLVHDYDGVNRSVIVEVVFGEMDQFIDSVKKLI